MPPTVTCEEELRVYHWRVRRCLELGFTLVQSRRLAENGADWHEAQVLLAAGCPSRLVYRLLK
jgi:hypothetical protein